MKFHHYPLLLLFSIMFLLSIVHADFRPDIGTRALGMGGAFVTAEGDVTALLWNPAGLSEVSSTQVIYDLSQGSLSAGYAVKSLGVLGLSVLDLRSEDRFIIESQYNPIGTLETGDNQIALTYARAFGKRLRLGGTMGFNRVAIPSVHSRASFGSRWERNWDVGAQISLSSRLKLGLRLLDVGGTTIRDASGTPLRTYSQQFTVGAGWKLHDRFQLATDLDTAKWELRFGGELRLKFASLRYGLITDLNNGFSTRRSAGLTLQKEGWKLHYAYLVDHDVKHRHLVALEFNFGNLSPQPPLLRGEGESNLGSQHEKSKLASQLNAFQEDEPQTSINVVPPKPSQGKVEVNRPLEPPVEQDGEALDGVEQTQVEASVPEPDQQLDEENDSRLKPSLEETEIQEDKPAQLPPSIEEKSKPIGIAEQIAGKYRVELDAMLAIVAVESSFRPDVVSEAGAAGLVQLMPATARWLGLKVPTYKTSKKPNRNPQVDERFNPQKNLDTGMKYFRYLLDRYNDNFTLAIAAYHAGPGNVHRADGIPDRAATQLHIGRIMTYYNRYMRSQIAREAALQRLNAVLREK